MTRQIFSLLACVAAALLVATAIAAPVAAQANTTVETGVVSDDPDDGSLSIDGNAEVVDWSYSENTYTVELEANETTTVYAFPPMTVGESDQGAGESRAVTVTDSGRTITVDGGDQLILITDEFFTSSGNPYVALDGPDPLIGGPWTANDSRISAIGAFAAAIVVVSWKMLKHLSGVTREPERVA